MKNKKISRDKIISVEFSSYEVSQIRTASIYQNIHLVDFIHDLIVLASLKVIAKNKPF